MNNWRGVRVVEGARLESVYTLTAYRGFESLLLRQTTNPALCGIFCLLHRVWIRTRDNQISRFDPSGAREHRRVSDDDPEGARGIAPSHPSFSISA